MTAHNPVTPAIPARSTTRRRMVAVAAFATGAVLALSGCSAGQEAQTASQAAAVNGNRGEAGEIALRNVHITFSNADTQANVKGGHATLALTIVNISETLGDELTEVTTELGHVTVTPASGDRIRIEPLETVVVAPEQGTVAQPAAHGDEHATPTAQATPTHESGDASAATTTTESARMEITGLTEDLRPGLTYNVEFNFKENGTVTIPVPVDAGVDEPRRESELSSSGTGGGH